MDDFRSRTQRFFYPKMARKSTYRTFTVADAAAIPQFQPRVYADYGWLPIGASWLVYAGVVGVVLGLGYRRLLHASR